VSTTDFVDAVKAGDTARVRELLASDEGLATARDENGVSALMLARYMGSPDEVVAAIRERVAELDVWEAATFGDVERLRELLDADADAVNAWSSDRATPLHFASFFGQPAAARLLVERGADVHAVSPTFGNVTPLHSAAAAPSTEIVALLLDAGADANARQAGGFLPLQAAAQIGDVEMARALLDHGAAPGAASDDGRTAAAIAAEKGHDDVAALLRQGV
jgi:uncharacterized protein